MALEGNTRTGSEQDFPEHHKPCPEAIYIPFPVAALLPQGLELLGLYLGLVP